MRKLFFCIISTMLLTTIFAQKKFSVGANAVWFTTNTRNQEKKSLFANNIFGAQLAYRKNTVGNNFLTVIIEGTFSNENIYNYQSVRLGYEVGNLYNVKNLFLLTEIGIGRFNSIKLNTSTITFAPSLGLGYNIYLSKSFLLRPYNNLVLNIPTKVATVVSNWGVGLHYCFDKK